jgi:hypothetical protein
MTRKDDWMICASGAANYLFNQFYGWREELGDMLSSDDSLSTAFNKGVQTHGQRLAIAVAQLGSDLS